MLHLDRYNVANGQVTPVSGNIPFRVDSSPTMIKLTGINGFDGAIIGDLGTAPFPSTGILFVDSTGSLSFEVSAAFFLPPSTATTLLHVLSRKLFFLSPRT